MITIVMTHSEAIETVKRHIELWKKNSEEIIFISPVDSPMTETGIISGYIENLIGKAEHHGELSAQRIEQIFEYALMKDFDYLILTEYDAFFTEKIPDYLLPDDNSVTAIKYRQNKPIKFKGRYYLHYPMIFTKKSLSKTYQKLSTIKTNDRYYSDRFIGMAVDLAQLQVKDLLSYKKGFSKNTILPEHYPQLRQAVKEGAIAFHGVKTEECLKLVR